MTPHDGFLGTGSHRSSSGRKLWIPQCTCGWRSDGYYTKPAAQRAVDRHLANPSPGITERSGRGVCN
jgi:hypothetical protein